jgi:membrane protease YdiL (CAAX protease family)
MLPQMKHAFVIFVVCEIAYVASRRWLLHHFAGGLVEQEFYWSVIRILSIGVLVWLFRSTATSRVAVAAKFSPRLLVATGMFLAPILTGDMGPLRSARYLFAATSVLVAVREELAYRGIFQAMLTRRVGIAPALLISNLVFVAYHIGVGPFRIHFFLQVFLCGTILGIVYYLSGSLILAIVLHAIYDAVDSFAPYLVPRMPDYVCTIVLGVTLAILVLATRRLKPVLAPPPPAGRMGPA